MPHSHTDHDHDGSHAHGDSIRGLRIALILTAVFLLAEIAGGIISNSLALLADAGHMLTDVAALALSLFVAWFSHRPRTAAKTYGYLRWEILAAFLNGATLLLVSVWIMWEAVARLQNPEPVAGGVMLAVAAAGLLVNLAAAWILHPAAGTTLNLRGAYLHVLGDLLGSVATVVAAILVRGTGWIAADPVASILVTVIVVRSAWALVRESVDVLLESTPAHVPLDAVRAQLGAIPGIESVHDLHVWSVGTGMVAMSVHAIVREPERQQHVLQHVHDAMRLFGIQHVTVQLERHEMHERSCASLT
ncbi:MAG: cation diffusion facilitator family transporter [Gemmatimonadaceae bacterium]